MTAYAPREAVDALAAARAPYLIGVRHHAPSLAAAMPALLDAARPEVLLVELPAEARPWLEWLAHPGTQAPVALAGNGPHGLGFYPFADFSPELAALRWAAANGVEVVPCDLPLAHPAWAAGDRAGDRVGGHEGDRKREGGGEREGGGRGRGPGLYARLRAGLTGRDGEDLWDRLVEAPAPGSAPEALRRAALAVGWALRQDAGEHVAAVDLAREAWMRARIAEAGGRRAAAVVGAFHAAALVDGGPGEPVDCSYTPAGEVTMSLIPYTYALLDARSGYPAGIRDPEWQHEVLAAGGDPAAVRDALTRAAVRVSARLRADGHPSGPADAREVVRVAADLAALRGLPAPGRGELVEAAQTVLTHGEPLGRGRAVAAALEHVLVGTRTGRPAPGTPRGGLGPDVEAAVAELGLPGPGDRDERDLRLDPVRVDTDRRRDLLLHRMTVCRIPYAEPVPVVGTGGAQALTTRWRVRWTPATTAMLEVAAVRGATLEQAAEGVLREARRRQADAGGPTAAELLDGLDAAARCGVLGLTGELLAEAVTTLPATASLREILGGLRFADRVEAGLVDLPGLAGPARDLASALTAAAVRGLDALAGSDDPDDARSLVELAGRADRDGGLRLADALARVAADGSPLMASAAAAVRVLTEHQDADALGTRVASWVDGATTPETRRTLTRRLIGLLTAAGPLLEAGGAVLTPLLDRVTTLGDREFVDRLPALRAGFDTLSPADRGRLLDVVEDHIGDRVAAAVADPALLVARAAADVAGREALAARRLWELVTGGAGAGEPGVAGLDAAGVGVAGSGTAGSGAAGSGTAADRADAGQAARAAASATEPGATASGRPVSATGPGVAASGPPVSATGPGVAASGPAVPGADAGAGPSPARSAGEVAGPDSARVPDPVPDTPRMPEDAKAAPAAAVPGGADEAAPASVPDAVPASVTKASGPVGVAPAAPAPAAVTAPVPAPVPALVATSTPAPVPVSAPAAATRAPAPTAPAPAGPAALAPADRWRLVLGRRQDRLDGHAARLGAALDELYGSGRGEGSRGGLGGERRAGDRGGTDAPRPGIREWADELTALFGPGVREEVLAAAVAAGRVDAAGEVDPALVRPSVELLRTVLSYAGALPEARLARLRPLVRRMIDELARELATRMRPALTGLASPRPTRRPGGPLDLAATVRANLATARPGDDGTVLLVPEKPVFRTRARRSADWRVVLVVDVSGSMEASTIWSALTASILAGVPALTTHFVAFSTKVMDLTDQVADPLALLLEVSVGGGTDIAVGLRRARELVTVPSRTIVAVVSDFEDGGPPGRLLGEVRRLVGAGCHVLGVASLDDDGKPRYCAATARQLVGAGMPVAALSPTELARWIGEKVR